jgi:hypothetical protein
VGVQRKDRAPGLGSSCSSPSICQRENGLRIDSDAVNRKAHCERAFSQSSVSHSRVSQSAVSHSRVSHSGVSQRGKGSPDVRFVEVDENSFADEERGRGRIMTRQGENLSDVILSKVGLYEMQIREVRGHCLEATPFVCLSEGMIDLVEMDVLRAEPESSVVISGTDDHDLPHTSFYGAEHDVVEEPGARNQARSEPLRRIATHTPAKESLGLRVPFCGMGPVESGSDDCNDLAGNGKTHQTRGLPSGSGSGPGSQSRSRSRTRASMASSIDPSIDKLLDSQDLLLSGAGMPGPPERSSIRFSDAAPNPNRL